MKLMESNEAKTKIKCHLDLTISHCSNYCRRQVSQATKTWDPNLLRTADQEHRSGLTLKVTGSDVFCPRKHHASPPTPITHQKVISVAGRFAIEREISKFSSNVRYIFHQNTQGVFPLGSWLFPMDRNYLNIFKDISLFQWLFACVANWLAQFDHLVSQYTKDTKNLKLYTCEEIFQDRIQIYMPIKTRKDQTSIRFIKMPRESQNIPRPYSLHVSQSWKHWKVKIE